MIRAEKYPKLSWIPNDAREFLSGSPAIQKLCRGRANAVADL
jgi:hypothetical protein